MTSHHIHQGAAVDHGICVKLFQSEEGEGVRNIVPQQFYTTYLQIMKITLYLN